MTRVMDKAKNAGSSLRRGCARTGSFLARAYRTCERAAKWATALTAIVTFIGCTWGLITTIRESNATSGELVRDIAEAKADIKKLTGDVGEIKGMLETRQIPVPHLSLSDGSQR